MNEDREAVVLLLAGGKGTRIKRLGTTEVLTVPKSLIRIRYKGKVAPMMFFAMDSILAKGYRNFVALVGADPETGGVQIEKALEQRYHSLISSGRMSLTFFVENTPLGTAGAVNQASRRLKGTLVITPLDTIFPFGKLPKMVRAHRRKFRGITWVVTSVSGKKAQNAGRILVESKSETIAYALEGTTVDPRSLLSRGITGKTSAGVVLAEASYFSKWFQVFLGGSPSAHPVDLYRQLIPWLVTQGEPVGTFDVKTPVVDLGTPERIMRYLPEEAFLG